MERKKIELSKVNQQRKHTFINYSNSYSFQKIELFNQKIIASFLFLQFTSDYNFPSKRMFISQTSSCSLTLLLYLLTKFSFTIFESIQRYPIIYNLSSRCLLLSFTRRRKKNRKKKKKTPTFRTAELSRLSQDAADAGTGRPAKVAPRGSTRMHRHQQRNAADTKLTCTPCLRGCSCFFFYARTRFTAHLHTSIQRRRRTPRFPIVLRAHRRNLRNLSPRDPGKAPRSRAPLAAYKLTRGAF